jgi:hypothetical protein
MRCQQTLLLAAIGACVATAEPGYGASASAGVASGVQFINGVPILGSDACLIYAQGQEKQRRRDPRTAIIAYEEIIEKHRDEIEYSAPALVNLVACFQLLKGDASAEARYASLASKYLSKPPPLDGASVLDLEQAKDDMLWKVWSDPVPLMVGSSVLKALPDFAGGSGHLGSSSSAGDLDVSWENGIVTEVSGICHTQHVVSGRLLMMLADIRKMKPSGNTCTFKPFLRVSEDSMMQSPKFAELVDMSLTDHEGREYKTKVKPDFGGGIAFDAEAENVPRALARFATIRGHVKLSKARAYETAELRLTPGATATLGTHLYKLTSVSIDKDKRTLHVVYAETNTAPDSEYTTQKAREEHRKSALCRESPVLCTETGRQIVRSMSQGDQESVSSYFKYDQTDNPV